MDVFWMAAAGAMNTAFGTVSMIPTHCLPTSMAGASAAPPGRPVDPARSVRRALCRADRRGEIGKVVLPVGGPAEFASRIRGPGRDGRDSRPRRRRRRSSRPVAPTTRMRSNAGRMSTLTMTMPNGLPSGAKTGVATRNVGTCGVSMTPYSSIQVDRRDIDLVGGQLDGFLEIRPVALSLQFRVGHDPNRAVRARAVDAEDFASAVFDPDDAELRIGRLGFEIGDQIGSASRSRQCRFGEVVDRIDRRR